MKKIFVLFIGILVSMTMYAQEKNALVVKLTNGSTNTFVLSNKPVVTMPDNNVVISGDASATYARSEVEKFYFIHDDGSGIESIGNDNIGIFYEDDGKNIGSQKSDGTGSVTISLGNHPKGIYIISFGGRSIKVRR